MNYPTPVLESDDWVFPVSGQRLCLVEDGAGNLRANPIPTDSELAEFYARHFERASYQRRGKALQGWHRAWRLRRLLATVKSPRILDFGFGNGQFLRACRRRFPAAELVGFEMSEAQCRLARDEAGAAAFADWEELAAKNPGGFDLITAWHVLEHAPDPGKAIRELFAVLKPGGSCLLAVPNRAAWGLKIRQAEWAWCQAPYIHIWHFSPAGIERMIRQNVGHSQVTISTRDAWDGNLLVDGMLNGLAVWRWSRPASVRLRLESGLRLVAAMTNEAILNPLVFSWSRHGSELLVTLTKGKAG